MRLLVAVQARLGSSRLPGKVLLPVCGEPLLACMLRRVRAARIPFELCVVTTTAIEDDPIVELCHGINVRCYRGHPTDLLDRHFRAGRELNATAVAKIPSDCPLIDPAIIERVLGDYLDHAGSADYVSNLHPATYPDGNDVEVMSMDALRSAHGEASQPFEREHTTPYIWERPERFRLRNVTWESGLDYSMSHRFALDYPEDYRFIAAVFEELGGPDAHFGLHDILDLLERKPELSHLNARYLGVNWYRHHLKDLKHVRPEETRTLEAQ